MMDTLFYVPPEQIAGDRIELTGQEAHHATNVLRASEGEPITVADGRGTYYHGTITNASKRSILIDVNEINQAPDSKFHIVLALGIIKKRDRLEFAVEKAVELGAREIALVQTEHTEKSKVRTNRLERVMISAMKQSLRAHLPDINVYGSIQQLLDAHPDHDIFIADEKTDAAPGVSDELQSKTAKDVLLLVGPEGGFSEEEVRQAEESGATVVSLGTNRLRAESAAVVLMSQFLQ